LQAIAATVGGPLPLAAARTPVGRHRRIIPAGDGRLALLVAAGMGVLALLIMAARWLAGHLRLRRSLGGDGELATIELVTALPRLGYALPETVTLAQVERLVRVHGGPDAARYVRLLRDRRYGAGATAAASLRDRRVLRARLTSPLGLDARVLGLWALPPATVGRRVGARASAHHAGGP
jgi:hypothetical protein